MEAKKSGKLESLLWFTFSATATISAFLLPAAIVNLMVPFLIPEIWSGPFFFPIYFFIVFTSALYHGLYRSKTIIFDLGLVKWERAATLLAGILFLSVTLALAYIFLAPLPDLD